MTLDDLAEWLPEVNQCLMQENHLQLDEQRHYVPVELVKEALRAMEQALAACAREVTRLEDDRKSMMKRLWTSEERAEGLKQDLIFSRGLTTDAVHRFEAVQDELATAKRLNAEGMDERTAALAAKERAERQRDHAEQKADGYAAMMAAAPGPHGWEVTEVDGERNIAPVDWRGRALAAEAEANDLEQAVDYWSTQTSQVRIARQAMDRELEAKDEMIARIEADLVAAEGTLAEQRVTHRMLRMAAADFGREEEDAGLPDGETAETKATEWLADLERRVRDEDPSVLPDHSALRDSAVDAWLIKTLLIPESP